MGGVDFLTPPLPSRGAAERRRRSFFLAGDTLDTGVSPGGTYTPAPAFRKAGRKFIRSRTCNRGTIRAASTTCGRRAIEHVRGEGLRAAAS
eukprot:scaffold51986_cov77-Phaeocystis_antarctica.AAC.3